MQMLGLLRHNSSFEFVPQITTLLTDLGASNSEVNTVTENCSLEMGGYQGND